MRHFTRKRKPKNLVRYNVMRLCNENHDANDKNSPRYQTEYVEYSVYSSVEDENIKLHKDNERLINFVQAYFDNKYTASMPVKSMLEECQKKWDRFESAESEMYDIYIKDQ